MKTKMIILAILIGVLGGQAQNLQIPHYTIVPIENYWTYKDAHGIPDGTYFKDVNHVLDKYVGTWEGTYENKSFLFEIDTLLRYSSDPRPSLKFDEMRLRYDITDLSGNVIVSTLNASNGNALMGMTFERFNNHERYEIIYSGPNGEDVKCGDSGTFKLQFIPINSKIKLFFYPKNVFVTDEDCPNGFTAPPFPDSNNEAPMVLTKQD